MFKGLKEMYATQQWFVWCGYVDCRYYSDWMDCQQKHIKNLFAAKYIVCTYMMRIE